MKKTLLLVISLLLVIGVALGLAGCKPKDDPEQQPAAKTYTLESAAFNTTAVFGEKLSLNGLKLVEAAGETVNVTSDMVSGVDTNSAGEKTLTISYNDQTFTVKYTVKFRIVFVVNGVETTQLVTSASEIKIPEPPTVVGQQFDSWSVEIPTVLTSNLRIDAIYRMLSGETEDVYTWTGTGVINLAGYVNAGATAAATVTDADGNPLTGIATVNGDKINYTLGENNVVIISISGDGVMSKSWKVQKTTEPTVTIANGDEAVGFALGVNRQSLKINVAGSPVSLKYSATASNANVGAAASNGYLFVEVYKAGVTELTLKVVNSTNELESVTVKQYVVVTPKVLTINNKANGIENIITVGRLESSRLPAFTISAGNTENVGDGFYDNITWVTGNPNVTVSKAGAISLEDVSIDPEIVALKAVFSFKGITFESAPVSVRCVYDGINVFNYAELYSETVKADPRPIVLQANIKDDFSSTNFTWMKSTYDLTYYQNIGATEDQMKIKVLMQFRDDVYGNGYEINAHNATIGTLDSTGKPTSASLFKGPLNFVAMAQGGNGGAISVKGQDNIVFGVYEGVTLNNIVLKSCDLTAVDGKVDLTELDYAGTTVEILGDNVTIEYSRLMNGRTVLRAFGDAVDPDKEINLTVKNTILKNAREFIARIGSNRFVIESQNAAPYLPGDSSSTKDYEIKKNYNLMSDAEKATYDEKYINTFVTFENCVFEDAGIFAIYLDTHFAGEALRDGSKYFSGTLIGWKDLAKTSYGAKITLRNDVRLYSWKPIDDIDSSTLLENNLTSTEGDINMFVKIKFDIKMLIESAAKSNPAYQNILYNYDAVDYVHAGIMFCGGGKNYSIVENKITSDFNHKLNEYNIKLSNIVDEEGMNQGYLQTVSGNEPFYFLIYNSNSTFTYETQLNLVDRYSCLYDD